MKFRNGGMYLENEVLQKKAKQRRRRMDRDSIFKVREVFALTNQLGTFFGNNKENFQKIFSTTFQGQRKPLSHHGDVIGAEIEKAR